MNHLGTEDNRQSNKLTQQKITERAKRKGITEEQVVLRTLADLPVMQGASYEWPDIMDVSTNAVRLLMEAVNAETAFNLVRAVVEFFDAGVQNAHVDLDDRKRLAIFVSKMITDMMGNAEFMRYFISKEADGDPTVSWIVVRGLILFRIQAPDLLKICGTYFLEEQLCASHYEQLRIERRRNAEDQWALAEHACRRNALALRAGDKS